MTKPEPSAPRLDSDSTFCVTGFVLIRFFYLRLLPREKKYWEG